MSQTWTQKANEPEKFWQLQKRRNRTRLEVGIIHFNQKTYFELSLAGINIGKSQPPPGTPPTNKEKESETRRQLRKRTIQTPISEPKKPKKKGPQQQQQQQHQSPSSPQTAGPASAQQQSPPPTPPSPPEQGSPPPDSPQDHLEEQPEPLIATPESPYWVAEGSTKKAYEQIQSANRVLMGAYMRQRKEAEDLRAEVAEWRALFKNVGDNTKRAEPFTYRCDQETYDRIDEYIAMDDISETVQFTGGFFDEFTWYSEWDNNPKCEAMRPFEEDEEIEIWSRQMVINPNVSF